MWHLGTRLSGGLGGAGECLDSILKGFSNLNESMEGLDPPVAVFPMDK